MSNIEFDPGRIKHLLFDLGGVLLNIDYNLTISAFKKLGLENFDQIYSQAAQDGLFDDFEKGLMKEEEFLNSVVQKFDHKVTLEDIKCAWNAMLLDFPLERLEMLSELNERFDVFLLSNTNEIHFNAFNEIFNSSFNRNFSSFFERAYYSHLIGKRKPDAEVFEFIIESEGLEREALLFIDDSEQHVLGARSLGIQAFLLEKEDDIISLLSRSGILT